MLNVKAVTVSVTLFLVVTYAVCVLYGLAVPESLHMSMMLEGVLPGFRWISPGSFLLGLGEAALYGLYGGWVYSVIHNAVSGKLSVE